MNPPTKRKSTQFYKHLANAQMNKPTDNKADRDAGIGRYELIRQRNKAEAQRDAAVKQAATLLSALRELAKDCTGQGYVPPSHGNALRVLAAAEKGQ